MPSLSVASHLHVHPLYDPVLGNDNVKCLVQDLDHHPSLVHLTKHLGVEWDGEGRARQDRKSDCVMLQRMYLYKSCKEELSVGCLDERDEREQLC